MLDIKLKVLVAMVTELCTHSISAMACSVCHAPEICILHTSDNFKKVKDNFSQTNNFSQIIKFGVIFGHTKPNKPHPCVAFGTPRPIP